MGKIVGLLNVLFLLFVFCGCSDYHEINETAMVAGIAVDRGETMRYRISVEIIQPAEGESSTPTAKVLQEEGDNAEDCLKRMVNKATKELRFSHCKLILFSKEISEDGIGLLVDGFLRNPEYRADLFLAVTKGDAQEMLKTGEKEKRISSFDFAKVIRNSFAETGSVPPTKLYQFVMDEGLSILPVFEGKDEGYSIVGSAGFRDGKIFTEMSLPQTQSVMLVSGEYKQGELLLQTKDQTDVPCQIRSVQVSKDIMDGDSPVIFVKIQCKIRLTSLPDGFDISTSRGLKQSEAEISDLLTEKIQEDWEQSKRDHASEVFGLRVYLYRHAPRLYERCKENGEIALKVNCSVVLENVGFTDERIAA